ncbi:hypothetical protein LSAT2_022905 [Lamellibrachia satsuma]|nr:hypothetical protein LSAT2_022905 [Lamellibrachia satsuma]
MDAFIAGNAIDERFYANNMIQVDMFYKELTEGKVQQQKAYEYQALLSELGGLMGLLMGASCLTLIEVLDFIIVSIFNKCRELAA